MTSLPISIGPPTVTINRDDRVLVTAPDGSIDPAADEGFFARDTRFVSRYEVRLNGEQPLLLNAAPARFFAARHEFTNPPLIDADGPIPRQHIQLRLDRSVAGGIHEDYDLVNFAPRRVTLALSIRIDSDFADVFEVKDHRIVRRGQTNSRWYRTRHELRTVHSNGDFRRELAVVVERAGSPPQYSNGRLAFDLVLEPKDVWHACVKWLPLTRSSRRPSTLPCAALTEDRAGFSPPHLPAVGIRAANPVVSAAWDQAVRDMEALRLEDPQVEKGVFVPAAGIPWFLTLFGRDALMVGMLAITGYPEFAIGALRRLAALQATDDDPQRDMEPGKILHEMRHGELAQLGLLPHSPYYGTHDATPLFLTTLSYLFHWTADRPLLERYLPNAEAALRWIDRYGDRDRDGFQEYATRSRQGYYNQGWKDAGDAIPAADGTLAPLPLALCELQGYVYDAKLRMAEIYELLDRPTDSRRLRRQATELYERFNDAFWWEEEGTYFLGLDGAKQPIRSVASNAGHLLQSGIVPVERAERVVARLMRDDMWSGWGIRTLSSAHPAYNPFSYHTGSVWPHDNAVISGGMRRYGFAAEVAQVARGMFDAAACFTATRLPELFAGLPRDEGSFPVQYLGANVPQAWAAATVFRLVALMAGLDARTDVGGARIYLDPVLPSWLPQVTIHKLRVGGGAVDVRLTDGGVDVLDNTSDFEIVHGPAPPRRGAPAGTGPVAEPVTRPD
ncbi:MAG TPA: glycogen debranching N-terminal domain-containing protein [Candidatus Limnocylindria bacterium]|nr:glycogen debranching N-terminal domain-containing protein [Candidatus Limnocylindria bacterium]